MQKKLIIKGHDNNPFVKFWNWGWNIYYKNPEIWNYIIVGLLTTIVSLFVYYVCTRTFLNPNDATQLQIANIISWVCAVLFAYITNRVFVFNSKNKNILQEFVRFVESRIASLFMDMFCMFLVVTVLSLNDLIGKIVSQIVVTITNYILSKLFVFKK
jgi:putative flippase GtrA